MNKINLGTINLANEKFFHTIQGEGKFIGYPTVFVRLTRCNLRCAWKNPDGTITRCDTPHTSFDPEIVNHKIVDLVNDIHAINCEHVVISGGEPYFQSTLYSLIDELVDKGHFVTIETNGTIYRETKANFISISPKLSGSSSDPEYGSKHDRQRIKLDALCKFIQNHDYQFKFVINSDDDIKEVLELKRLIWERIEVDINDNIWLMPQGTHSHQFDEKMEWLVEVCKQYDWKLTDRLHIRIWNQKKGV